MTPASLPTTLTAPSGPPGTVERARGLMLEAVIEPVLATLGFELVHLEWSSSGRQRKLQIFVDRPADDPRGGIDLEACARLSPILGNALDAAEVADSGSGPGSSPGSSPGSAAGAGSADPREWGGELARLLEAPYVLEVSSPGLERPLSRRSHFARFIGRLCRLRVFSPLAPDDAQRNFHGRIEAVTPDPNQPQDDRAGTVTLRDPDGGQEHHIPLDRVRRARLVYEG